MPSRGETCGMADAHIDGDQIPISSPVDESFSVPVVLVIFNRPDKTRQVVEQLRTVNPEKVLVIADGPRADHPDDEERCAAARDVIESVDWNGDILREYAETNLGLKRRLQTGLNWVFDTVDQAIILEDDCLPSESFFRFCECMLDEFADDDRVMDICGTNHLGTWNSESQDYLLTKFGGIWGWATWASRWDEYDPEMRQWESPEVRSRVRDFYGGGKEYAYIKRVFDRTSAGDINTWDFQWKFSRVINNASTIIPSKNLVTNVGFGEGATHTTEADHPLASIPRYDMNFPLRRNPTMVPDNDYDRSYYRHRHTIWERSRILRRIKEFYFNITDRL